MSEAQKPKVKRAKRTPGDNPNAVKYVTNAQLLEGYRRCKPSGELDGPFALLLKQIAEHYSHKSNWGGYSYREDMASAAALNLYRNWHKFDEGKGGNAFAYYTQCCYHVFVQYIGNEKVQRDIRDGLLVQAGANPSWSYSGKDSGTSSDNLQD